MEKQTLQFPTGFYWGSSTSSHQVEGNNKNNWSEWEVRRVETLSDPNNYISGIACDHYTRYREDIDIMHQLGFNSYRFSIEWSRIEPEEGKFNEKEIAHYQNVIRYLREKGIEPFVTLWHWTEPLWFRDKGSWLSDKSSFYFQRYVYHIAQSLKDDVRFWITLNEPMVYSGHSFLLGVWPPQKKNLLSYLTVLNNLLKAHKNAYEQIKVVYENNDVGLAKNNAYFVAYNNRPINKLIKKGADKFGNFYFLNGVSDQLDFIGLNYYFRNIIDYGLNKNLNEIISDMGWELYPQGIYNVLIQLKKYNKPIYITENGLADAKDEKRQWFINETLKAIHKAISEKVDVKGYLHWSLLDNFEWDSGFGPRFGLVKIDRENNLQRKIRQSAYEYSKICKANSLFI